MPVSCWTAFAARDVPVEDMVANALELDEDSMFDELALLKLTCGPVGEYSLDGSSRGV